MASRRWFAAWVCAFGAAAIVLLGGAVRADEAGKTWYKGATHAHSLWSDGDEFPEMAVAWYKSHGYQFVALSDHDLLMEGECWRGVGDKPPIAEAILQRYRDRFGADWVETRGTGDQMQVRLKTFDEIRRKLEEPGKFLMIPSEEISDQCNGLSVHLNVINVGEVIPRQGGGSVADAIRNNLAVADAQAKRLGRTIVAQVNHPNWSHFDIRAEDLIDVPSLRLFEACNGFPTSNHLGNATFPSTERLWDVVNAVRIADKKLPPLFGVASDDAHHYHAISPSAANPGRGWVVVRAAELTPEAIARAMNWGHFYASTGVVLRDVHFDRTERKLTITIDGKPGAKYTTKFIGTRRDFDRSVQEIPVPDHHGKPQRPLIKHSDDIGEILASSEGATASYTLRGDELYVRAVVESDQAVEFPAKDHPQTGMAWVQPVGWRKWLKP